ncbi:hypothetical protein HanIR_Chr10g0466511 [Helianthus annuus]|nr:hypothetical protein HanIR_Chr10g0466511 [Helianthus annuus]
MIMRKISMPSRMENISQIIKRANDELTLQPKGKTRAGGKYYSNISLASLSAGRPRFSS